MGATSVPTTTIIIASVASTAAVILLLGTFIFIILRRRRQHEQVPTDDPELVPKLNEQNRPREASSIDSHSERPLLYDDASRSTFSPRNVGSGSTLRQSSGPRFTQSYDSSGSAHPSIRMNSQSTPLFDTHGKDRLTRLPTGRTILSPTPPRSHEEPDESVDSHVAPSTIELPNPFAESVAPSTASPDPSTLSRSQSSLATDKAATCVPLIESPTQLTISLPLPDGGNDAEQLEAVSPAEILPVPAPAKLHAAALLSSDHSSPATPTRRGSLPQPPVPAPRRNSAVIRPLPRTPNQKAQLSRSKSAKSQSADMRITVLSSSTGGVKRTLDSVSDDSASVYSQTSIARSEWIDLVNPHDSMSTASSATVSNPGKPVVETPAFAELVNPHDRNVASAHQSARGGRTPRRPYPSRSRTTDSTVASSAGSGSSSTISWDHLGTLSSVPEDADPGSAAVSMRFALAQAVEAARRDSLYHTELEHQQMVATGEARSVSGVSVMTGDVEKFERDMRTWLASPRVSTPTELLR